MKKKTCHITRSLFIFLIILTSGIFASAQTTHRPKNVQTSLRAKWQGTPLLLEAGELLSREWKDLYWDFVENWLRVEKDEEADLDSAKGCLQKILKQGQSFLSEHLASLFEVSLTLRSASPRLVLYRQLAQESLSSYPLADEADSVGDEPSSDSDSEAANRKSNPLLVGLNPKLHGGKCCWVDTGSNLFFSVNEMQEWIGSLDDLPGDSSPQPELFEFDHVYLGSNASSPVAVLYGALGTDCFRDFHRALVKAAKEGRVKYAVRPVLPSGCEIKSSRCGSLGSKDPVNLAGYGVELALKNMEYKAMDDSMIKKSVTLEDAHTEDLSQEVRGFIFSKLVERKPELSSEIMAFRDYLLSSSVSDTLEVWELKDLGHQAAQKIVHASDPLQAMQEINQNFPSVVASLSRMKLNESVKDEILANQKMVPPGKSLMALNGAIISIDDVDLHQLVDLVHQELSLADQFSKLKIPEHTVRKFLSSLSASESNMFRIDFRSSHVHYINNLEEDSMYKRWRSNVNEILMPTFPGQLRYIRKNLFHAVYIVDPSTTCGLEVIDLIVNLYENQFPMRFGVILFSKASVEKIEQNGETFAASGVSSSEEDISALIIRLFMYIKEHHDVQTAYKFLSNIHSEFGDSEEDAPERHQVEGAFIDTVLPKSKSSPQDVLQKLVKEKTYKDVSEESSKFVFKLGFSKRGCSLLLNGLVHDSNEEALLSAMNDELPRIQEQVYYGNIDSHTDVLDKFMSESGIRRYNPQIIMDGKAKPEFVSLSESIFDKESALHELSYLHSPGTADDVKPVTHLLVIDVTSLKGIKLLREGIHYLQDGSTKARVGVLFGPNLAADSPGLFFVKLFEVTTSLYSHNKEVLKFLDQLCLLYERNYLQKSSLQTERMKEFVEKISELAALNKLPSKDYESVLTEFSVPNVQKHLNKVALLLHKHLGRGSDLNAVITNGRVTRLMADSSFVSHDLHLLESLEFKQRIKHITEIIEDLKWEDIDPDSLTSKYISDAILLVSSSLATRDRSSEGARFEILHATYSAVVLNPDNSSIHIDAVIDPLSSSGQKLSSLLRILWKTVQPSLRVILNPQSSLVDLPLKNYYRYVIPSMEDFSGSDYVVKGPKAFFANMPLSKTLTMNLDVPETWLVEPVIAVHDLDNILLENLGETRTLQAVFELEAVVLTGHCLEKDHDPPRGLQMILGTKNTPHLVDTLVMANLGYWQMKVSPGIWYLQLAPGRSSELYLLQENTGGSERTTLAKRITINDFRGKVVHLGVVKKKGKEHEKLLDSSDDDDQSLERKKGIQNSWNKNIFQWASGLIGGNQLSTKRDGTGQEGKSGRHGKPINIFSVASGHLYERFLKIMILSVLKNTQRPVKFWFIKNYLSPPFKDVLPHMAEEYGFDYELITYKWPTWLHKQTEKQRIIWAYKILFLDVIFPISLEKVIFVDADQVVRTDLGDLYDMDIKGKPLAYTPFCDNNKEMDGYRFWRQGFWRDHLRGKPYHISALYVVDLARFRQMAAGDTLRVVYETLSKDPNSLANLDQDLPNYAQHTVPIFSLSQEWLWCESWCGNSTKSKAKTIDLCNNPMTKEPKLQGAKRIISEWTGLDLEARRFTAKILGEDLDSLESATIPSPPPQIQKEDNISVEPDLESKAEL